MDDLSYIWMGFFVLAASVVVAASALRRGQPKSIVPVIQRRKELQDELASLLRPEVAAVSLRDEASKRGKPTWDISVLEACIHRVQIANERTRKLRLAAKPGSLRPH